jgi:uncharacterized protein (DUF3084 family)
MPALDDLSKLAATVRGGLLEGGARKARRSPRKARRSPRKARRSPRKSSSRSRRSPPRNSKGRFVKRASSRRKRNSRR